MTSGFKMGYRILVKTRKPTHERILQDMTMTSIHSDHHDDPSPAGPDETRTFSPGKTLEEERMCLFEELCESSDELEAQYEAIALERRIGKRVRAALTESEARYRSFFNATEDMIFLKDGDFRYLLVNASLAAFLGRNREEVVGLTDFELMPRETALKSHKSDIQALKSATVTVSEEVFGDRIYEARKFAVPLGQAGFGLGGFLRDVTAEREARARLNESLAMTNRLAVEAVAANKAKSAFLANISHELRTPLNAILGFAHVLNRETALTPYQADHLRTILRCGDHLLTLINTILEMARLESGQARLREAVFDLVALLHDLARNTRSNCTRKNPGFSLNLDPDLPRKVVGDMVRLRQILDHLLSNAFKFTPDGTVMLRVARISGPGSQGEAGLDPSERIPEQPESGVPANQPHPLWVRFEVRDTGPGIPVEDRSRIFESFQQGAQDTHAGGTGLGLTISRDLARLMGGDLMLVDEEEPGSCFRLEIPLRASQTENFRCGSGPGDGIRESDKGPAGVCQAREQDRLQARDDPAAVNLSLLTTQTVRRMHQALLQGDMTTLHALLREAEAHDPATVQALAGMARRYDYDLLETILAPASSRDVPSDRPEGSGGTTPCS